MAKLQGNKAKIFIYKAGTNTVLAGQRLSTISEINSEQYQINCDRLYILDSAAYEALKTAYKSSNNVDVYIEMPGSKEYVCNCSIEAFDGEHPYDEITEFNMLLNGSKPLNLISNK